MHARRPTVPAEYYKKSNLKTVAVCLFGTALWAFPLAILAFMWTSSIPSWLAALLSLPLGIVGAYGLMFCGWLAHDGFHFNLHNNKKVSSIIGLVMSVPAYPLLEIGFAVSHWNHHIHTNTPSDPDLKLFGKFNSVSTRLLIARPYSFMVYGKAAFMLALDKQLPYRHRLALPETFVRDLARLNILMCSVALLLHIYLVLFVPVLGLSFTFLLLCTSLVSGVNPYTEHAGVGYEIGDNARTKRGLWWDFFFLGNNYHIEHHLYPSVPFYNLKKVHSLLVESGYYSDRGHISDGLLPTIKFVSGNYRYETSTKSDIDIKPESLLQVQS